MSALFAHQESPHHSAGASERTSGIERRRHPRIPEENGIAVRVLSEDAHDGQTGNTYLRLTHDISSGGLRFSNADMIPENTLVQIHLALDMPRKIVTHLGKVRWARQANPEEPAAIGIEFTDTTAIDQQLWNQYLDSRLALLS